MGMLRKLDEQIVENDSKLNRQAVSDARARIYDLRPLLRRPYFPNWELVLWTNGYSLRTYFSIRHDLDWEYKQLARHEIRNRPLRARVNEIYDKIRSEIDTMWTCAL